MGDELDLWIMIVVFVRDEYTGAIGMITVRVAIDEFSNGCVGDVADGVLEVYAERGRVIDDNDTFVRDKEERLVGAVEYD